MFLYKKNCFMTLKNERTNNHVFLESIKKKSRMNKKMLQKLETAYNFY